MHHEVFVSPLTSVWATTCLKHSARHGASSSRPLSCAPASFPPLSGVSVLEVHGMHSSFPPSILRTFFIECICILKHAQNAYAFRSDIGLLCEILTVACRMHMHSLTMCTILDNILKKSRMHMLHCAQTEECTCS